MRNIPFYFLGLHRTYVNNILSLSRIHRFEKVLKKKNTFVLLYTEVLHNVILLGIYHIPVTFTRALFL